MTRLIFFRVYLSHYRCHSRAAWLSLQRGLLPLTNELDRRNDMINRSSSGSINITIHLPCSSRLARITHNLMTRNLHNWERVTQVTKQSLHASSFSFSAKSSSSRNESRHVAKKNILLILWMLNKTFQISTQSCFRLVIAFKKFFALFSATDDDAIRPGLSPHSHQAFIRWQSDISKCKFHLKNNFLPYEWH